MIVTFTKKEKAQFKEIDEKYDRLIEECEAEIERLRSDDLDPDGSIEDAINAKRLPEPIELHPKPIEYKNDDKDRPIYSHEEMEAYRASPEYQAYIAANDAANEEINDHYNKWEAAGSEAWREARRRHYELIDDKTTALNQLFRQCEQRQFSELKGDPEAIIKNAKEQIELMIKNRYDGAKKAQKDGDVSGYAYIRVDENYNIYVDGQSCIEDSKSLLHLHYEFFKEDRESTEKIRNIVLDAVATSPYIANIGRRMAWINPEPDTKQGLPERKEITSFTTKAPKTWLTPVDKVSNKAFDGEGTLYNTKLIGVDISSRKTKKEILSMVSLDFDDKTVQITGKRELTPYDREVHDAIVTLYVDGENEYITPQMVYRAMTGNANAKLTPKAQEAISNSLNKLMYSRLVIKASKEECAAYGFKSFRYEGTVIQAEKVTATLNASEVAEVYHLLKEPVLYSYAGKKDQIGRLDIKLLNSPVNKTEENITLQSYLYRRILAIKRSGKLSPTIVYETIYKQIELTAASDGALRKKKLKVRNAVKQILDYWKDKGFIKGYKENSRKTEIVSVTISY